MCNTNEYFVITIITLYRLITTLSKLSGSYLMLLEKTLENHFINNKHKKTHRQLSHVL